MKSLNDITEICAKVSSFDKAIIPVANGKCEASYESEFEYRYLPYLTISFYDCSTYLNNGEDYYDKVDRGQFPLIAEFNGRLCFKDRFSPYSLEEMCDEESADLGIAACAAIQRLPKAKSMYYITNYSVSEQYKNIEILDGIMDAMGEVIYNKTHIPVQVFTLISDPIGWNSEPSFPIGIPVGFEHKNVNGSSVFCYVPKDGGFYANR